MLPHNTPPSDPLLQEAHLDCPGQGPVSPILWIEPRFRGSLGSLHTRCLTHTLQHQSGHSRGIGVCMQGPGTETYDPALVVALDWAGGQGGRGEEDGVFANSAAAKKGRG